MVLLDRRPYDVYFPDVDLGLYLLPLAADGDARSVEGEFGPAEEGVTLNVRRDVPQRWADWSGGGGISQAAEQTEGLYAWSENVCARYPRVLMPSGALTEVPLSGFVPTACTASFELGGDVYFIFGRFVARIVGGTTASVTAPDNGVFGFASAGISATVFTANGYVGTGSGGLYKRTPGGGGVWTRAVSLQLSQLGTVYWATTDGRQLQRLLGTDTPGTFVHLSQDADEMDPANWSTSIKVAGGTFQINRVVTSAHHAWFSTSGGLADVQATGFSPILNPYFALGRDDAISGRVAIFHNNRVYTNHPQFLDAVDVSGNRQDSPGACGWGSGTSNETPIWGEYTAATTEGGWLVVAVWNGTDSYVLYGRDRQEIGRSGPGPLAWFPEYYLPGEKITQLRPGSPNGAQPRLWIASVDSATGLSVHLRWASLPHASTPLQEYLNHLVNGVYSGSHRWARDWKITFSATSWGDSTSRKVPLRYDLQADYLNTTTQVRLFVRAEGGSFVQEGQGDDPAMLTSPRSSLLPTSITKAHNWTYQLRGTAPAASSGAGTAAPAAIREFKARAQIISELRESRQYRFILGPFTGERTGPLDHHDPGLAWETLKSLQTHEATLMEDEVGTRFLVRVEPGMRRREAIYRLEGGNSFARVIIAEVMISQVPATTAELGLDAIIPSTPPTSVSTSAWRWGSSVYGAGDRWA